MSKIFYDQIVDLEAVEKKIKKIARTAEEREELYQLVDEILHHKVLGCILDKLPKENHEEFLTKFSEKPHDEGLWHYLAEKIREDVEAFIKYEVHKLVVELTSFVEEKTRPEYDFVKVKEAKKLKRKN